MITLIIFVFGGFFALTALFFFGKYLVQFPVFLYWIFWDIFHFKRDVPYGIFIFCGLPGNGKTTAMVDELLKQKEKYPKAKIYTNFGYWLEDGQLTDWQDLVKINNGEDGVIFGIDEIHSIFTQHDWNDKDIPPGILKLFSQHRKQAKMILGTTQRYGDVLGQIRSRTRYAIQCNNIGDRWFFQTAYLNKHFSDEDDKFKKRWVYRRSFVADNSFFGKYDSFSEIENLRPDRRNSD